MALGWIFLLFSLPVTQTAEHCLTYFVTTSYGLQTFPEFVAVSKVDGVNVGYCDSINKTAEPRLDWVKQLIKDEPQHFEWHVQSCLETYYESKAYMEDLKQRFTGGVHIFQEISSCQWDNETGEVNGYQRFGYDGEDYISLDLKTLTWQYSEKAATFRQNWDKTKARLHHSNKVLTIFCPHWLKEYLKYGKSYLWRTELPSVSLLQKTPSSPVSCRATGFYPDRAVMYWRKDGVGLHEDVHQGEILPNHDGTFQISADLNISLIKFEDWRRYDCVFQLSGAEHSIITTLDKGMIRTNWVSPSEFPAGAVIGVVVGLLLLALCITGLFLWIWFSVKNEA